MSILDFAKRFFFHATVAMLAWFLAAVTLEHLIPGSVTPFVNVPEVGLMVTGMCVVSARLVQKSFGKLRAVGTATFLLVAITIAASFVWARVNVIGLMGVGLVGVGILLGLVAAFALIRDDA